MPSAPHDPSGPDWANPTPVSVLAEAVMESLERRGVRGEVTWRQSYGVAVTLRASWPFGVQQGHRGHEVAASGVLDLATLRGADIDQAVDAFLRQAQANLLTHLLPVLLEQAEEVGVRNALLAPFAREVVNNSLGRAYRYGDPAVVQVRAAAMPYIDADGKVWDR